MEMKELDIYDNTLYRLWAVMAFGVGNRLIYELSRGFSDAEEMFAELTDKDSPVRKRLSPQTLRRMDTASLDDAKQILEYCSNKGINIVTQDDELYPSALSQIYAPPSLLFYKGEISGLRDCLSVGVVGTRQPSDYSVKVTRALTKSLAEMNVSVISGFAVGIDITAQLSAAAHGGKTYAVLGTGIDHDYPAENSKYRKVIEEHGALISEYLPLTKGNAVSFPQRNRILAGLSMGVAVIEAGEKSGSLNTAGQALSQGRDIFVVPPHDLFDTRYAGNVKLLRDGAIPLFGTKDIMNCYADNFHHPSYTSGELKVYESFPDRSEKAEAAPKKQQRKAQTEEARKAPDLSALEGEYLQIAKVIAGSAVPMCADDISRESGLPIDSVLMLLTELEIDGTVTAASGCYTLS